MLTIQTRQLGRRRPLLEDWSITFPPEWADRGDGGIILRELIERVVRAEVERFNRREHERQMVKVLSAGQIADQAERGKVSMGGVERARQQADPDEAVGAALQAFEDGLYLVMIDEVEQRELDRQVFITPDSAIAFIRLTMLAGGW